ncbi:MAG TPA: hypothetical protein VD907_03165 [Verrucomicrobiae bacterium]|nr:hypothetical protein [Verrucomicrobiae bacterium]
MNKLLQSANLPWLKPVLLAIAALLTIGLGWYLIGVITQPAIPKVALREEKQPQKILFDGRQQLLPHTRLVALYGAPDTPALGALGEQSLPKTLQRVKKLAQNYQPHTKQQVYPALEVIATVAAAEPTADSDYSREIPIEKLEKWVREAEKAKVYVVLDLQPGRTHFLTQAKRLEKLLLYPHVGLALDPEWRLKKTEQHLEQIGSVHAHEVNQTAAWLASLTRHRNLPQKVFLLHQFRSSMIHKRELLRTHPELAHIIQMDGHGDQPTKLGTWQVLTKDLPQGIHMGWKNFYNEDTPTFSPAQTYGITPVPWFVSYQ